MSTVTRVRDSWSTAHTWLRGPQPAPTYVLSRTLFLRALGVVYFVAFVSLAVQIVGLVGEEGILPATDTLAAARSRFGLSAYHLLPTIAWLSAGDGMLRLLAWSGAGAAAALAAGVTAAPLLAVLWMLYLSLTVVGQVFLNFQWDVLLLETGLLAVLYAPLTSRPGRPLRAPLPAARALLWWLVFRLMFLSGITKIVSRDATWADWTALTYHYETQPIPTWTSWYVHHVPDALHVLSTGAMFAAELAVPFLIFAPPRWPSLRRWACGLLVLFQTLIAITGNYGFFNLLTAVLCLSLLDDDALRRLLPRRFAQRWAARDGRAEPRPWRRLVIGATAVLLLLSTIRFSREIEATNPSRRFAAEPGWTDRLMGWIAPFRSVNGYGLFRVMTTERPEIVIEVSVDGTAWSEMEFRWKAGDPWQSPRFVAPHMPRLDWQMWFAALDPSRARPWLVPLLQRIMEGRPHVRRLLADPPFADPPRLLRLAFYRYRFSTPAERRNRGSWWQREFLGYLTGPLSSSDLTP